LVKKSLNLGLSGIEWAVGIPGSVGGAVYGNAGSFEKSMKDIVKEVRVYDIKENKIKNLNNKLCNFSYRESVFKKTKKYIIISVVLKFKKNNKKEIKNNIKNYLIYKKRVQPLNYPSAGSVFKNPKGFSAAKLIEDCGLKGKIIGGAKISEKHANFIVNFDNAKAEDVKKLIFLAKKLVKNKFKINLKEEINIF
jgi:UDP-N-acetylmuramate dehydrogenase